MAETKKQAAGAAVALYFGNDSYWVTRQGRERIEEWAPGGARNMGLEIVDGRVETPTAAAQAARKCCEAAQTPPFLGADKTIWLKNASFLGASGRAVRGDALKNWMASLTAIVKAGLPPGVRLLVTAADADKRSAFYKACEKAGEVREFAVPEKSWEIEKAAPGVVRAALADAGLEPAPGVVEALAAGLGADTQRIRNEVEKLALYASPRPRVTVEDVESVVTPSRGSEAWDLADAAADRRLGKALTVLKKLLFQKEYPIRLIIALEGRFRELALYREALDRGWMRETSGYRGERNMGWGEMPDEARAVAAAVLGREPGSVAPFVAATRARQARSFTRAELARIQAEWLAAHRQLVSSAIEPQWILEMAILRALRPLAASGTRGT